ncbi:MAG: ABC transporter permease [Lachnospiraceae bacterium]|nr:ABC transporter permease [Lachnospiraceae bacterium]
MQSLKYRYLQVVRDRGNMFWGLFYPMILATFFFIAFGDLGKDSWKEIPVALVAEEVQEPAAMFVSFLETMDGELITVTNMTEEEALAALSGETVEGIFFADGGDGAPALTVGKSGLRETMLSMLLDAYVKNAAMYRDIALSHPERLQDALSVMQEDVSHIREVTLGGKTYDHVLEYFFASIAMMCFFGCFTGQKLGEEAAANVSRQAARRSISPEKKSLAVLGDLTVGISIQFASALLFLLFLQYGLRISLGGNFLGMALICLLGSMVGVSLGMVVGSAKIKEGFKTAILVALPLFLCFLAGLMFGEMKVLIERSFPLLNRVNPAALISDALYFLNVYNDPAGFRLRLFLLFVFAAVMTIWAFVSLRRTRYDSI